MKFNIFQSQIIRSDPLSLPEGTLFPQLDHVIDIPVPFTLTETVKPDHIVSIHIQAKAVLGVRMEGTEGTVSIFAGGLETDTQMGLGIVEHRFQVGHCFDVVVGRHVGIIGKWGWDCQDESGGWIK
jgi:hypothetical protein